MSFKIYSTISQSSPKTLKTETTNVKTVSGGTILSPITGFIVRIQYSVSGGNGENFQAIIYVNGSREKTLDLASAESDNNSILGLRPLNIVIKSGDIITIESPLITEFIIYMSEVQRDDSLNINKDVQIAYKPGEEMFGNTGVTTNVLNAVFD